MHPHTAHAVRRASLKLVGSLAIIVIMAVVGAYWATNGFEQFPNWSDFKDWSAERAGNPQN